MGQDTTIGAEVYINSDGVVVANKSIKELSDNVKQLKKNLENAKVGSDEHAEAAKKLKAATDDLNLAMKGQQQTLQENTGHFSNIKESISQLPGPLGEAGEGVSKLNGTLLKLLANPVAIAIMAIVGALAFLYKSFTNTFEGGEKMEQLFAGLKAVFTVVLDRILAVGGAIIKLFSGDFKGALADAKKAVTGVGDEIVDTFNKVADLTKKMQELHKEQLKNNIEQAEREKQLAILRDQANDESVPVAKRKAALLELRKATEEQSAEDIRLAKQTAETKIALLSVGTDAEKKNQDEINQLRVDAINKETAAANEKRRIDRQIHTAELQEQQDQKAAEDAARQKKKEAEQQMYEFQTKLHKLQNENELAGITDTYKKEMIQLEQKFADERAANERAFKENKLTRDQLNKLNEALAVSENLQRDALKEKHNKEVAEKEVQFQNKLNEIREKTMLDGLSDAYEKEKIQLDIEHQKQINDAIKQYKDDAAKLAQLRAAIDAQYEAQAKALKEKHDKEEAKKDYDTQLSKQKAIISERNFEFAQKRAAVDAEQALVEKAFQDKLISEADYNSKQAELANARVQIRQEELNHSKQIADAVSGTFDTLTKLAGEQTAAGKAFAVVSTTIKTYQSAVAAFAGMTETIPGPVGIALGVVAAAGALASGLETVQKILAVQVPGKGNAGGAVPTAPKAPVVPVAPVAPKQASTQIAPNSIQAITSASSAARAYVLQGDIASNAERDARLSRAARLGG